MPNIEPAQTIIHYNFLPIHPAARNGQLITQSSVYLPSSLHDQIGLAQEKQILENYCPNIFSIAAFKRLQDAS
jgi:hypothetical protein